MGWQWHVCLIIICLFFSVPNTKVSWQVPRRSKMLMKATERFPPSLQNKRKQQLKLTNESLQIIVVRNHLFVPFFFLSIYLGLFLPSETREQVCGTSLQVSEECYHILVWFSGLPCTGCFTLCLRGQVFCSSWLPVSNLGPSFASMLMDWFLPRSKVTQLGFRSMSPSLCNPSLA